MEKKIDVMVVGFGDWRENWIVNGEWCGWNVWFMMKRMIDDMVKGYEWNKNCGCDDVEIDFVEVMKGFDIKDCGYFMDVRNEVCSEFGMMVFNVEKMKELGNKVVKSWLWVLMWVGMCGIMWVLDWYEREGGEGLLVISW